MREAPTGRGQDSFGEEVLGEPDRGVLGAGVAVMDQLAAVHRVALAGSRGGGHAHHVHHQVGALGRRGRPGNDPVAEAVDHERHVHPPGVRVHVREVGDPLDVRCRGSEIASEQVTSAAPVTGVKPLPFPSGAGLSSVLCKAVSGWCLQVGVDAVGVGQRELGQGGFPVGDGLALDEPA